MTFEGELGQTTLTASSMGCLDVDLTLLPFL